MFVVQNQIFDECGECEWLVLSMSRPGAVYVGYFLGNASRFFEDLQLAEGFPERERVSIAGNCKSD